MANKMRSKQMQIIYVVSTKIA